MDRRSTRHRLTRLGIHVMLIGAFGVLGGSLNGLNLLIAVAALILATLVVQWRVSRSIIDSLRIDRRLPAEAFAGKPIRIRYQVNNEHRLMPMWLIRIEDGLERIEANQPVGFLTRSRKGRKQAARSRSGRSSHSNQPATGDTGRSWLSNRKAPIESVYEPTCTAVGLLMPSQTTSTYFDVTANRRGRYRLGRWQVSTLAPFALSTAFRESFQEESLIDVFPRLLRLQRSWQQSLPSRVGNASSSGHRQGQSDEVFFGLREYRHGDSPRHIHWRTTARLGEPSVRQFEQQRRFDLCLLVDACCDAGVDNKKVADAMIERAISLAASVVVELAHGNQSQVLLVVAGQEIQVITGNASPLGLRRMLQSLARIEAIPDNRVSDAMMEASAIAKRLPDMVVMSPRSQTRAIAADAATSIAIKRWKSRSQLQWVDVTQNDFQRWAVDEPMTQQDPMTQQRPTAVDRKPANSQEEVA